jgi:hypothetical protein
MTISASNELPGSQYVKLGVFASRADMEAFVVRLQAEGDISYDVTVYPADAMDATIPVNQSWAGGSSYAVVARGKVTGG